MEAGKKGNEKPKVKCNKCGELVELPEPPKDHKGKPEPIKCSKCGEPIEMPHPDKKENHGKKGKKGNH